MFSSKCVIYFSNIKVFVGLQLHCSWPIWRAERERLQVQERFKSKLYTTPLHADATISTVLMLVGIVFLQSITCMTEECDASVFSIVTQYSWASLLNNSFTIAFTIYHAPQGLPAACSWITCDNFIARNMLLVISIWRRPYKFPIG